MDDNKKIGCTVESCKYNDCKNKKCNLDQIQVTPMNNCDAKTPEESMCSSYENE